MVCNPCREAQDRGHPQEFVSVGAGEVKIVGCRLHIEMAIEKMK